MSTVGVSRTMARNCMAEEKSRKGEKERREGLFRSDNKVNISS